MLHRSFKAGKCKTSLKLAVARIKLLKNKREVQLKQMKRDLANLLETGQEKTAMIRVEHVVREEKTMAAYDFIDIYCELVVARLPIIESQKNCPIDLKEAVSSLMFASPRCADIPELVDVRKHFTAKYGKEFATSALELRPDCGVNRTVVENLSARAPDGQTKLKILAKVAQEHNVQWDPEAFGEKELKPSEDLLSGPHASEVASWGPVEPIVPQHSPSVQKPESSYLRNFTQPSQSFQSSDSTNARTPNMTMHNSTESRASGGATGGREFERLSSQDMNDPMLNRQNWNMEFKDATSAAQAAAESAERASLAARAAADLAGFGKVTMQHSTGLHKPLMQDQQRHHSERESVQGSLDRVPNSQETPRRRSSQIVSSGKEMAKNEDDFERTDMYCQKCSTEVEDVGNSLETKKPEESNIQPNNFGVASIDHHQESNRSGDINTTREGIRGRSTRSSFSDNNGDVITASNVQKYGYDGGDQSFSDTVKGSTASGPWQTKKPEESRITSNHFGVASIDPHQDVNIFGHTSSMDEGIRRPSRSSSSFSDNNGDVMPASNTWKYEYNGDEQSTFDTGEGSSQSGAMLPSFNEYPSAVFDEAVSDDESYVHDVLYPRGVSSPSLFPENLNTLSPEQHRGGLLDNTSSTHSHFISEFDSPSEFSERISKISSPSKSNDLLPAAFDDSDGVNSESEEEIDNLKLGDIRESSNQLHKQNPVTTHQESVERVLSTSPEKPTEVISKKSWLHSSSADSDSDDAYPKRHQEAELNVKSEKKNIQPHVAHTRLSNNLADDNSVAYNPVTETKQQQQQLPLQSSRNSLAKDLKTMEDFVVPGSPDEVKDSRTSSYLSSESGKELEIGVLRGGFRNKGYTRPPYRKGLLADDSTQFRSQQIEDSGEKPDVFSVGRTNTNSDTQEAPSQRSKSHFNGKLSSRAPKTVFDSDSDDAEMVPRQSAGSRGKLASRYSRRTRESPTTSDISDLSMSTSGSRVIVSERDEFSQDFHAIETPSNSQIQARGSGSRRPVNASASVKHSTDPQLLSRRGGKDKLASASIPVEQQPLKSTPQREHPLRKSSAAEQTPNPPPNDAITEESKVLSWNKKPESRENSLNKASHVHPKLPDYDTFAAHFESLRSRR